MDTQAQAISVNQPTRAKRKQGRPRTREGLMVALIDRHFQGNRRQAALAWKIAPGHLANIISGTVGISGDAILRIHQSTKEPIELLLSLQK